MCSVTVLLNLRIPACNIDRLLQATDWALVRVNCDPDDLPDYLEDLVNCHPVLLWVWTGHPEDFFSLIVQPEDGRLSDFLECVIYPEVLLVSTVVLDFYYRCSAGHNFIVYEVRCI